MLSLIFGEVANNLDLKVKLDIQVQIVAKLSNKEYGENNFSFGEKFYHRQHHEDTNEDDLGKKLNDTVDEVKSSKEEDQDKDSMMEYRHFISN